ncbi:hypothetical protein [Candidatus Nitrospira neomarina]|uniref:Uncharacterized protein n=1 Tax=Candidatus Nitrospira neomarina TaxID=3020899 RepID=A0AA96GKB3_9BACT|nr:hypothetical protein [Candidatus Nitrospira neomarina]WNM61930.1 hypothetical protein PQG83_19645 [Candidatus Nitrospira neomarina]
MEITNPPLPTLPSPHSTSSVQDGDVGQKGSFYSRNRKKQHKDIEEHSEEPPPNEDSSTRLIDIRV